MEFLQKEKFLIEKNIIQLKNLMRQEYFSFPFVMHYLWKLKKRKIMLQIQKINLGNLLKLKIAWNWILEKAL